MSKHGAERVDGLVRHVCKQDKACICGALAEEPHEECPVHGCQYPPRCACGRFVKMSNAGGERHE